MTYNFVSRSGNETQFIDMVSRCNSAGVSIVVDAVINHMAAGSGTGVGGSSYGSRNYPFYSQQDFHHYDGNSNSNCQVNNYYDKYNVQYCGNGLLFFMSYFYFHFKIWLVCLICSRLVTMSRDKLLITSIR